MALGEGAEDETDNAKFAKRTWNVPWNQWLDFLASHFSIADWVPGPSRCERVDPLGITLQAAQTWERKVCASPG